MLKLESIQESQAAAQSKVLDVDSYGVGDSGAFVTGVASCVVDFIVFEPERATTPLAKVLKLQRLGRLS